MATAKEMRALTAEDLAKRANELKEALFNQRIKHRSGTLESSAEIGKNKRELARVLTILGEKSKASAGEAAPKKA